MACQNKYLLNSLVSVDAKTGDIIGHFNGDSARTNSMVAQKTTTGDIIAKNATIGKLQVDDVELIHVGVQQLEAITASIGNLKVRTVECGEIKVESNRVHFKAMASGIWKDDIPVNVSLVKMNGHCVNMLIGACEAHATLEGTVTIKAAKFPEEYMPHYTVLQPVIITEEDSSSFGVLTVTTAGDITVEQFQTKNENPKALSGFKCINVFYVTKQ
jgi:hypothetical protein